ncbi:MAG: hypothetical protein KAU14_03125 [Thermoplasmata archaeon]|nr:hypothetical protein [Thermoplasmata archaeon]
MRQRALWELPLRGIRVPYFWEKKEEDDEESGIPARSEETKRDHDKPHTHHEYTEEPKLSDSERESSENENGEMKARNV